jgi:hypothetical protein
MESRAATAVVTFHEKVAGLCRDRLADAFNPTTELFDRQLRDKHWSNTIGTEDVTSTGICLIGLHRANVDPAKIGIKVRSSIEAMLETLRRRDYAGGLGLVLWANAVWGEFAFDELLSRCSIDLKKPHDFASSLTTMETAWLLSGLIHESERTKSLSVRDACETVLNELLGRFRKDTRIFLHASDRAPMRHRMRKNVANFADQIYSVQAMAFAALTKLGSTSLAVADSAARRLVELQGNLGQWWWHYDPRSGGVAQGFPVYSVHQHAMAPMALMAVTAAGGSDFRTAVELSHRWVSNNELSVDLLDTGAGTLWRDIEPEESEIDRIARHGKSVLGWRAKDVTCHTGKLRVNFETRPYEWAWCLYAGAIASGQSRERHVV